MNRLAFRRILIGELVIEVIYTLLRWADNRRKGKPVSDFWNYIWVLILYGEVNGYVPLGDIDREWRDGTWFERSRWMKKHFPGYQGALKERG